MLQSQLVAIIHAVGAIIDPLAQVQVAAAGAHWYVERQVAVAENVVVVVLPRFQLAAVHQQPLVVAEILRRPSPFCMRLRRLQALATPMPRLGCSRANSHCDTGEANTRFSTL